MIKKLFLFAGILVAFSFISDSPKSPAVSTPSATYRRGGDPVDFKLTDMFGKEVSLSDYRGKFVVIDFWASWCRACRAEMPAVKKLVDQMSGNDKLVFLFISFDQDEDAWKNAAKHYEDYGEQLIAGDKNDDLKAMFNMDEIPHFAWINSKGVIVKINAPRPSDIGSKATLQAYLLMDK